jgi:protein gp37
LNKTDIEYGDYAFNPYSGCYHGCKYCFARGFAQRFEGGGLSSGGFVLPPLDAEVKGLHVLDAPEYRRTKAGQIVKATYPYGFEPTLYRYRMNEPYQENRKHGIVLVAYDGDLFGEWVPDEWIQQVFAACERAPWNTYMFLTKNFLHASKYKYHDNWWIGATFTDGSLHALNGDPWSVDGINRANLFLSIEPLLSQIKDLRYYLYAFKWVIVGAETGNRKGKVIPKREWVERIVTDCRAAGVPVFMKDSLRELMGVDFIQEWPEGRKGEV